MRNITCFDEEGFILRQREMVISMLMSDTIKEEDEAKNEEEDEVDDDVDSPNMEVELDSGEMVLKNVENQLTGEQLLSKYALGETSDKQQNEVKMNNDQKEKQLSVKDSINFANRPITPHNVKHSQVFIRPSNSKQLAESNQPISKQSVTLNGKLKNIL